MSRATVKPWLAVGAAALAAAVYLGSCGTPSAPQPRERTEAEQAPSAGARRAEPAGEPHDAGPDGPDGSAGGGEPSTEAVLARMRAARDCYRSPDCRIEGDDPRERYYRAGKAVAEGLRELQARHAAGEVGDAKLGAAAREFMAFDNPHAREAALDALSEVPPDPRNLEAIIEALDQHYAARLFEPALEEFQRYSGDEARERIDRFLQSNLRTGAHRSAETIARELTPFLGPDNVDDYEAIAAELDGDSRRAELIRRAIDEYRRRRSDG